MLTTVVLSTVLGGLGLIAYALAARQRMRELVMKERIALIEKGLVPPPEVDPARFESLVQPRLDSLQARHGSIRGTRYRSAGIMVIGLGTGLFLLLAFATNEVGVAFGIGGAFVVLGAALFLNGVMLSHEPPPLNPAPGPPPNTTP